jgi:ribosomal protein S27AE
MIDDDALVGTVSSEPAKSAAKKKNSKRKRSEDDEEEAPKLDRTVESLERKSEEENDDDDDDNNSCGDKRGVLSVNAENEEKKEKKTKKIKKSVNFSLNHLEDVAGVADDIDREAWELPRTCDGCGLYILGERWSCGKCVEETEEEFDFCKACFVAFMEVESKGGGDTSVGSKSHNTNNNDPWSTIDGGGAVQLTSADLHKHDSNSFLKFDEENEESIANVEMKKAVEQ